jgi:hypothetical protein
MMRLFRRKLRFVLAGAAICALTGGCPLAANQTELSSTLLTFAEDLYRQILAAYLL